MSVLFRLFRMDFEKAYCFYRLNKLKEAEDVLKSIENPSMKEKDLLAQVVSCFTSNIALCYI